ncbi:LacI family transcriptional regulator [Planobispora rosea]|uniref:LacI family transcriptional regulator n=1 Tax=Planobispora rosea TaxID=35762 RepID=A0A8J3WBP5_PLARO|nr:LacI family DNA-binding transcriptional regulator [Planobispora rosea]GGS85787.1 LacI family transcriptional regulator [Planobispora rosea]GIH83345.1 LacI family transcriptional regulator [Planobispora rosea]
MNVRRATIKDVAEAAGVGVATVSRVLSGGSASPETRERVLTVAAQLDYRPSALGRNLRQRRSGGIGLLVPDITDSFYGRLVDGVLACARSAGEPVVLGTTGDDAEREAEQIGMLLEQGVERVVAVPAGNGEIWEPTLRSGITTVFAHRPVGGRDDVPAVLADDRAGVRTAVDYLTGLGHRRIAYLGGPGQGQRVTAFRQSLGALLDEELIVSARGSRDSAYAAAAGLFQHRPDLTAVLAGGNLLGEAAVLAARELDLRVPRDLSLVMFDDVPWAELCAPPLTVIAQPAQDIGYRAAELVLRAGGRRPRGVLLPTELIVRGSCGPRRTS